MEKHPNFNGKIVIMGYSLGGIIVWDILSHQREPEEHEAAMYDKMDIKFSKLAFKPNYFFGLGSPVGAVLTFRGQDPKLYHPEFDIQFENIFHPFDPLGYRFEPLFNDYFTDKPAVLVKRSVPIGPSFSFPSMPSFPLSAGFLSFFSWRQEDKVAKSIYNATAEAADANQDPIKQENARVKQQEQQQRQDSSSSSGFMSSFLQYFSKGGGTEKLDDLKDKQGVSKNGIITWDPLKEQTREQLLALRDDLDRTLNGLNASSGLPRRPAMNIRSKTVGTSTSLEDSLYSSSLEQNSDGSVFDKTSTVSAAATPTRLSKGRSSFSIETQKPERIALRKSMTEHNPKRQHLVEVLGIDGVRVDSFERARAHFDKPVQQNTDDNLVQPSKDDDKHLQPSIFTTKSDDSRRDNHDNENASGGDHLWSDLDKEMNKPGPALTSPGESRADIAQDATVPAASKDEEDTASDLKEEQEAISTLPGKQRMDYVLQPDSVMSMIANEYLIGLRAHFSYWTNKDFIWHMLRRIEDLDLASSKKKDQEQLSQEQEQQENAGTSRKLYHAEASSGGVSQNKCRASIVRIDHSNISKKKK
ncbi:DDHD domain-containing protein [Parasitella parasitica]|nr:DDHD domain-containing protein [Parasitella parasitica]